MLNWTKGFEGRRCDLVEVRSRNLLPIGIEESPSQDSRYSVSDSKLKPPEYISKALDVDRPVEYYNEHGVQQMYAAVNRSLQQLAGCCLHIVR
jgi:hypothetical protein